MVEWHYFSIKTLVCGEEIPRGYIKVAGFVFKYPCRMSFDKGERARLGRLVKQIDFWYGEQVQ